MNQEKQNNSEIINDFSNLKSDIYFEGVDGKQYVIEYITFYFVNQLFYNGDKEDLHFVADLQSKIEEDADGNQIEDVGQMDMYVRMYDELKKAPDDNPTIGIVLCSETDEDIAKYSVLKGNEQLFASKYKLYLPTEDELRAEIENQKTIFELQQQSKQELNNN